MNWDNLGYFKYSGKTPVDNEILNISANWVEISFLKVVSATFLPVCFVCLKESTCETMKMFFISLRKLFLLLR